MRVWVCGCGDIVSAQVEGSERQCGAFWHSVRVAACCRGLAVLFYLVGPRDSCQVIFLRYHGCACSVFC